MLKITAAYICLVCQSMAIFYVNACFS